jgi:hypothetical protein
MTVPAAHPHPLSQKSIFQSNQQHLQRDLCGAGSNLEYVRRWGTFHVYTMTSNATSVTLA